MPAYIVATYEITDPERYQKYLPGAGATIQAHGGELLAAERSTEVLEGPAPPVTVIIRFPDKATAEAWYRSEDYQAVVHFRQESSKGQMVIADGFVAPS
jgi:uncharacterized protein (DUF1330 family)